MCNLDDSDTWDYIADFEIDADNYWLDFHSDLLLARKFFRDRNYGMAHRRLIALLRLCGEAETFPTEVCPEPDDPLSGRWHDLAILVQGADEYLQDNDINSFKIMLGQIFDLFGKCRHDRLSAFGFSTNSEEWFK